MKVSSATSALLLYACALTGCTDDAMSIEVTDFAGFWTATQFEYEEIGGAALTVDAIDSGGGSVTLDVAPGGAFTGHARVPGLTVDGVGRTVTVPVAGRIEPLSDDVLRIEFDAATEALGFFANVEAGFDLHGNVLTFDAETEVDFPDSLETSVPGLGARAAVPATLTVTMTR
jgi:hypothetical protein